MLYYHADVFSSKSLSGNGLTVIFHEQDLDADLMQRIAQEFKQFETIFLKQLGDKRFRARIFTVEEELDFAGHPVLGATASIHERLYPSESGITVALELNKKTVQVDIVKKDSYYNATMNQGAPAFLGTVGGDKRSVFLKALNLSDSDLHPSLPMEVVSTGLPYLLIPLIAGLDKAKISVPNFEALLSTVGAKFAYLIDVDKMEARTWDNLGAVEDVATGSAAGPTGAYLMKHNVYKPSEKIQLTQGTYAGRPSKLTVYSNHSTAEIFVSGDVTILAKGELLI